MIITYKERFVTQIIYKRLCLHAFSLCLELLSNSLAEIFAELCHLFLQPFSTELYTNKNALVLFLNKNYKKSTSWCH